MPRRVFLIFPICCALSFAAATASAFDFRIPWTEQNASFEITETLVLDYHDDNFDLDASNDDYGDIRNRLNLKLAIDAFTFSARLDTSTFIGRPASADPPYLDRYAPEKLSAGYRGDRLQVDLGDFYASIGRGIALRIRKTDELSEDTTLLGGKARTQLGPVELTALAGLSNPTNTDGVTEKTLEDPYDLITAADVSWRPLDWLVWSAHTVWVKIDPLERNNEARNRVQMSDLPSWALVAGSRLELPALVDWMDAYAELDWLEKDLKLEDLPAENGWALYLNGNFYLGDWTITAECKAYRDYQLYTWTDTGDYQSEQIDYIRPPTLEPENMEVRNNHDVAGGRLQLDWRPGGGDTLLFANYAGFVADDGKDPVTRERRSRWIYNLRLGAEQDFLERGRAKLDAGLREEVPDWAGIHRHLIYLNVDIKIPLSTRHSLELHGTNWWVHEHDRPPFAAQANVKDTLKGELTLGWLWSPYLSTGVIVGYDTDRSGSRELDVFFVNQQGAYRQMFLAGTVSLNLASRVVIKLLAGQLRGGDKCVSGACRTFPPFSGVRLETVVRL